MRHMRRTAAVLALTLPGAFVLAGCAGTGDPNSEQIELSGSAPATYEDTASWEVPVEADLPIKHAENVILAFSDEGENRYSPVVYSDTSGQLLWQGRAITSASKPTLDWVEEDGRAWVVVTTMDSDAKESQIYVWDADTSQKEASATTSATFTGKDTAPRIIVSGAGVLVRGAEDMDAAQYHLDSGSLTELTESPERDDEPGTPMAVSNDGFLFQFPDGGFSFGTDNGGWRSSDAVPEGAAADGGRILDVGEGFIVSQWAGADEDSDPVIAVHSMQTGQLLSQVAVDPTVAEELEPARGEDLTDDLSIITDYRHLAYGTLLFDLSSGQGEVLDLNDGEVTATLGTVLYVTDMSEPLPGQTSEGFTGSGMIDMTTGESMVGAGELSPMGQTSQGEGLFLSDDGTTLYSVASI